jgi:hypothetical protein
LTSQGHPRTIFRRALEHDNLVLAEVTSREIGRVGEESSATARRAAGAVVRPLSAQILSLRDLRFHLDWVMFKAQAARDICRGKPGGNSGRCGQ